MKDSQKSKKKLSKPKKLSKAEAVTLLKKVNTFIRNYETDFNLLLITAILIIIFGSFLLINTHLEHVIQESKVVPAGSITQLYPYPFISGAQMPEISAKSAIITDSDTQVILYSKNPNVRFSMASTTKIMTALTALDYYTAKSILTVKTTGVEGSILGLQKGDKFYFEDLLYMMMLPSANDAAFVIADNYPGGKDAFVRQMNKKANSLHLTNTHFAEPTGLDDDQNFTTVIDMARMASSAIKDPRFAQVTSTRSKVVSNVSRTKSYPLENLNKLLGTNGVTGIKTGTTEAAGEVLVTSIEEGGHTYILVVMNSQGRFIDTQALLDFIKMNVKYVMPTVPL